jgi:hypothetical protein
MSSSKLSSQAVLLLWGDEASSDSFQKQVNQMAWRQMFQARQLHRAGADIVMSNLELKLPRPRYKHLFSLGRVTPLLPCDDWRDRHGEVFFPDELSSLQLVV